MGMTCFRHAGFPWRRNLSCCKYRARSARECMLAEGSFQEKGLSPGGRFLPSFNQQVGLGLIIMTGLNKL